MMDLMNKRMIVFEEIGNEVDNDLMKRVTGGGQITGVRSVFVEYTLCIRRYLQYRPRRQSDEI